jgi:hypothetical protein
VGNDIEIRVKVSNDTGTGIAAVNTSLQTLKTKANEAGNKLEGLATKATLAAAALEALRVAADGAGNSLQELRRRSDAAGDSMRGLRDGTNSTNNSIRTLNTRTQTANTRLGDLSDRTRTLRSDTDDLDGSMRRLTGTTGGLRGNLGTLRTSAGGAGGGMERLTAAAIALSPALIPVVASAVPLAASMTAGAVAVGAFGAAVAGQLVAVKNAADAQKKYDDAVRQHGKYSDEATKAQAEYLSQVQQMDPATRRTAAALGVLKDQYKDWSKSLAGDTMPVVTKGLAVFGGLLPRLTPMVKGASTQLDRFMTILGGGVNSSGFSAFMDSFGKFSTGALSKANDALVHFMRTMQGGTGSSQLTEFMAYAKQVGPQVADTLGNVSTALVHLIAAASDTGVSMLGIINSLAKLVNAVPSGALSNLLQFAIALKAVRLAAAGMAALGGLSSVATAIGAMRTAAAGASGPLASLSAAFGTLSRSAKVALVGAGIGLLVIALTRLSQIGKQAPPDVDRMTTALGKLADTGKVSGEAARVFGDDLSGLGESLRTLSRPSNLDKTQQFLTGLIGMDSTPVKKAKEDFDSIDKALANLVKGGKADLAKVALEDIVKSLRKQGFTAKEVRSQLDDYKSALADQALEARLTAEAQGLFGAQAQKTQAALDAQKQSADGLRGAIQALNDVNRTALGGMIGFEGAIDAAAEAAKKNAGALSMTHGQLDLNSQKARDAASALSDLAAKTDEAAADARQNGSSWEQVGAIYDRGRAAIIRNAQAMGLSRSEARQLAGQILKIPDKTARVKMNAEDARAGLNAFNAAVRRTPGSKSVTLKTLSSGAEQVLKAFGYRVTHLKNGSVRVSAATGGALGQIRNVQSAVNSLHGKTVTVTINGVRTGVDPRQYYSQGPHKAHGGLVRGYASGGEVQAFPNGGYVQGPGSPTSDSITALLPSGNARVSDSEFVVQASAVRRYGVGLLNALNAGRLKLAGFARGGLTQTMKETRASLRDQFGISHFGVKAGYSRDPFEKGLAGSSDVGSLVSALNAARSNIKKATAGGTESRLLRQLDSVGKGLIKYEKSLVKVNASLEKAKSKLDDLKNSASQLSSSVKSGVLSASGITKGITAGGTVTVSSIMSGLVASRDKATAFSGALKGLKSKGLDKSLIQQIAEAGIEGGGLETAGALLSASGSEIKSVNSLQSQIASAASSAGKTTADAVYGAAIKSQEKLVNSLKKQQDKLEKAMSHLAKVMEKSISKAIGKKAAGGIVGAAASGGVRGGLTWVGEHEPELLELPVGSRVWSGPDSRRKAAGGGGGPARVELELRSSGSEVDELLLKLLRRAIRVRGGNVNVVLTGRP